MDISHKDESLYEKVKPVLQSKVEEFTLLGYDSVTEKDIWDYLVNKTWKKKKEVPMLYEVVQSILTLKIGDFMNYQRVEALKDTSFSLENEEDRLELLK
ncbi:post-transcriptional regulator [Niallia sp. Krafla_26]|uniref:post-transcriptional regulator n=1 Tax=Niallia sp. Krafla_26 TaxID=3064703 RepID=UPI003D16CD8C